MAEIKASWKARLIWIAQPMPQPMARFLTSMARLTWKAQQIARPKARTTRMAQRMAYLTRVAVVLVVIGLDSGVPVHIIEAQNGGKDNVINQDRYTYGS
jgi:hypothetical protein